MFDRQRFIADLCRLAEQGVRFLHQGRDPSVGMDCIAVPRWGIEQQGGRLPEGLEREFDAYHFRPDGVRMLRVLREWLTEIDPRDAQPGDLLLFYLKRNPQHLAVKVSESEVVEAYKGAGKAEVLRQPIDPRRRICAAFRIPDFETT